MLKNRTLLLFVSMAAFIASYFALFYLITFNGAGVQPEAFFVSITHFSFDPTQAIDAFYHISPLIMLVLIILTIAYGMAYRTISDKNSSQKYVFYFVLTFLCVTICLSVLSHLRGSEENVIIGVSYLLNILAFKNYAISILLMFMFVYPLLRIKNKRVNH